MLVWNAFGPGFDSPRLHPSLRNEVQKRRMSRRSLKAKVRNDGNRRSESCSTVERASETVGLKPGGSGTGTRHQLRHGKPLGEGLGVRVRSIKIKPAGGSQPRLMISKAMDMS